MVSEKKLDPVNDKELDKKFKDRKDKDIDNDGDVDSSDEYLHKRRKAINKAIDGDKKPAKNVKEEKDEEEEDPKKKKPFPPKKDDDDEDDDEDEMDSDDDVKSKGEVEDKPDPKKKDKNPRTADKTAEISKIGEAFDELWSAMQEAINQKKGATEPEKMDSKASPKEKEFTKAHEVEVKGVKGKKLSDADDPEKPSKTVKTEMKEYEVIRALLSGKPLDGE